MPPYYSQLTLSLNSYGTASDPLLTLTIPIPEGPVQDIDPSQNLPKAPLLLSLRPRLPGKVIAEVVDQRLYPCRSAPSRWRHQMQCDRFDLPVIQGCFQGARLNMLPR